MNAHIDELAKQATTIEHGVDNGFDRVTFDKEKFAKLIVRECISMCDTVSADYLKARKEAFDFQDKNIYAEGEAACDIIKYKMKKHFGVEQ